MDKLSSAQNNSERLSALSLIGQDVVVEESEFSLGAEPVQIGYKVDGTATDANLLIKNKSGKTVATLSAKDLSEGNHYLTWDGKDSSGNTLTPGKYSITIDAGSADGTNATVAPLVRSAVTGIDLSGTEPKIVTELGEYKISSIHGAYNSKQSYNHRQVRLNDRRPLMPLPQARPFSLITAEGSAISRVRGKISLSNGWRGDN